MCKKKQGGSIRSIVRPLNSSTSLLMWNQDIMPVSAGILYSFFSFLDKFYIFEFSRMVLILVCALLFSFFSYSLVCFGVSVTCAARYNCLF